MSHVHFFKETTPLFNVHLNGAPEFLDSGHISWMLGSRRWTLDATLCMLDSAYWTLDAGTLDAGLLMLDSGL